MVSRCSSTCCDKKKKGAVRIYLPKKWEATDLFARLDQEKINYVVLRWWERLPNLPYNDDINILTSNEHHHYFINYIDAGKNGGRVLDVYTVSGIEHSSASVTYYEPEKAREILQSKMDGTCGCKVPAPWQAFMSLIYHALYQKGFYSNLPSIYGNQNQRGKLYNEISKQATKLGIDVSLDMESLELFLSHNDWRPPIDKLARLSIRNEWVQSYFFPQINCEKKNMLVHLY